MTHDAAMGLSVTGGVKTRISDVSSISLGSISATIPGVNVALYPRGRVAPKRTRRKLRERVGSNRLSHRVLLPD